MKRYQEIEFTYRSTNIKTILKRIERKNPEFFGVWGEVIEYLFNQGSEGGVDDASREDPGYCIGVDRQEDLTYIWFFATCPEQVI